MTNFGRATAGLLIAATVASAGYVYVYGWPAFAREEEAEQEQEPPTPVVLAEVSEADVSVTVDAIGDAVARETVVLTSRVLGRVIAIDFTDGESLEAGDTLVRLDPVEEQDALVGAEANAEEARQAYERAAELAESGAGAQATADDLLRQVQVAEAEAEAAREVLEAYNIRAPFDGRVGLRNISLGALVQPGEEIATLDAVDPISIRFTVPERYLGQVRPGASIVATSPAFPKDAFSGEVSAVDTRVDPALRTVTLEASAPNRDGRLLPGMLMNVTVDLGVRADAVVAPPLAVQLQGATQFVVRVSEGKAERVEVQTGQRTADRIEILEGLRPGERVIVEGQQDLAEGQAVEERPAEAAAAEPTGPEG